MKQRMLGPVVCRSHLLWNQVGGGTLQEQALLCILTCSLTPDTHSQVAGFGKSSSLASAGYKTSQDEKGWHAKRWLRGSYIQTSLLLTYIWLPGWKPERYFRARS